MFSLDYVGSPSSKHTPFQRIGPTILWNVAVSIVKLKVIYVVVQAVAARSYNKCDDTIVHKGSDGT